MIEEYPRTSLVAEEWSLNPVITSYWQRGRKNLDGYSSCLTSPMDFPLQAALVAAGLDRNEIYVTNAVKHFKWQLRGKRRLHKTPAQREIDACHQWLEREIQTVQPQVIVAMGATAARAVIGKDFKVSMMRGQYIESPLAPHVFATFHPSALLRLRDEAEKEAAFEQLVQDFRLIGKALGRP